MNRRETLNNDFGLVHGSTKLISLSAQARQLLQALRHREYEVVVACCLPIRQAPEEPEKAMPKRQRKVRTRIGWGPPIAFVALCVAATVVGLVINDHIEQTEKRAAPMHQPEP